MKLTIKKFRVTGNHWNHREFDPNNAEDLNEYKYFLQHQRWKNTCPFLLEWPFLDMIQMIEGKIVRQHINKIIKDVKQK